MECMRTTSYQPGNLARKPDTPWEYENGGIGLRGAVIDTAPDLPGGDTACGSIEFPLVHEDSPADWRPEAIGEVEADKFVQVPGARGFVTLREHFKRVLLCPGQELPGRYERAAAAWVDEHPAGKCANSVFGDGDNARGNCFDLDGLPAIQIDKVYNAPEVPMFEVAQRPDVFVGAGTFPAIGAVLDRGYANELVCNCVVKDDDREVACPAVADKIFDGLRQELGLLRVHYSPPVKVMPESINPMLNDCKDYLNGCSTKVRQSDFWSGVVGVDICGVQYRVGGQANGG